MPRTVSQGFTSPDIHRSNGFGRSYVDAQLGIGFVDSCALDDLRGELLDSMGMGLPVASELLADAKTVTWMRLVLAKLALSDTQVDNGMHTLTDGTFANILQIHNYKLAQKSEELRPQFDAVLEDVRLRVGQLIEDAILPISVLDGVPQAEGVGFAIGDASNTHDYHGVCEHSIRDEDPRFDIILSPKAISEGVISEATVVHELVHGIGKNSRTSLCRLLQESLPDSRMAQDMVFDLEEGLTEHIAQVILGDRHIEYAEVEVGDKAYPDQRAFLEKIKVSGISIRDLVFEYFDAREDPFFPALLREAFSSNATSLIYDSFCVETPEEYDEQDRIFSIIL